MKESKTSPPTRRAADALVESLHLMGIDRMFCVPGESYLALLDALHGHSAIDVVTCRHEGSAGMAAVADAKLTGRLGAVAVSRGPGMGNLTIAIHLAQQDAVPLLVLVGQVERPNLGRGAFQEVDYARMFSGMAKWVGQIDDASRAPEVLARAAGIACAGTPGPCLVILPEDMLSDPCVQPALPRLSAPQSSAPWSALVEVSQLLRSAHKPVIIAGGVDRSAALREKLQQFAERWQLPVAVTNKNQDLFDNHHPLWMGHVGYFPNPDLAAALSEADLIVAINTELGDVDTQNYRLPKPGIGVVPLVHVHPDPAVLGRLFAAQVAIATTGIEFLGQMLAMSEGGHLTKRPSWLTTVEATRRRISEGPVSKSPYAQVVRAIDEVAGPDAIFTVDAGNFSVWVHRLVQFGGRRELVAAACGAMGIAVPAALAGALRFRSRPVIAFVGDGGFLMTGNELATAVAQQANVKIFVANNSSYSTIRMYQERTFPGRVKGTSLVNPDFAAFAASFGALGLKVTSIDDATNVVREAMAHDGPCVVDVACDVEHILPAATITSIRQQATLSGH
jgi:acetolactate synthase-1/2/3 large subunit